MIKPLLPLSLALILLISTSGCTIPYLPATGSGGGVIIEDFSTGGISNAYPGETITFIAKIRNTGSEKATGVFSEMLGLDQDWAESSRSFGNFLNGEIMPSESKCRHSGSGFELIPGDPAYSTTGESTVCSWKYSAPEIPKGMNPTYDTILRVYYNYQTNYVRSFTLLPTSELQRLNEQGQTIPSSTQSISSAPVTISMEAESPVRIWESSVTFPIKITITNSGGGVLCLNSKDCKKGSENLNKLHLSIDPLSKSMELSPECSRFTKSSSDDNIVEVWTNKPNTIICDVTVQASKTLQGPQQSVIAVKAAYGYYIDARESITIL